MNRPAALKVAILWHMHQPNYFEPKSKRLAMPWVRLHALKDYLDMPLLATSYENIRITFNLVPSLIDQLDIYLNGGMDRHLELSKIPAEKLSEDEKQELLNSFFDCNEAQMIKPYPRFYDLYKKRNSNYSENNKLSQLFSSQEIRDIQVWSNLVWVDPSFRNQEPIKSLIAKNRYFTEKEKQSLLSWEIELIGRIVPTYKKLQDENRIEISFTPYYHPILPLLCDSSVATEALPSITLPKEPFVHPEDAKWQIEKSIKKYQALFDREMAGMWPSEGSISDEVLDILSINNIFWAATDQEVLIHSLIKSGLDVQENPIHSLYESATGVKLLFRDHALSDRIGFVYSSWDADKGVSDFMGHLKSLRSIYSDKLDSTVVPVILDGENAWEYYQDDGIEFLNLLYKSLSDDQEIEMVTMGEAALSLPSTKLPTVHAGSWINHNFRIWIGHREDNTAWDILKKTRDLLSLFQEENPNTDKQLLEDAWRQIYIAEGSDWNWWYGDEHLSGHNDQFDKLYRRHLAEVYEIIGHDIPIELLKPISSLSREKEIIQPEGLISPQIDGRITQFFEWSGAGFYDCTGKSGAMHQVEKHISALHFAYDHDNFYIRLDFASKKVLDLLYGMSVVIACLVPEEITIEIKLSESKKTGGESHKFKYALSDLLEISLNRRMLWQEGYGKLGFSVLLMKDDQIVERWPEVEPIGIMIYSPYHEMFWPVT